MANFHEVLSECNLFDLGFQGAPWTYNNMQEGNKNVKRNWGLIKDDIVKAVQQFFISGIMPDGINNTTIVLILKIKNPQTIKDFRPISLCNVIYKIISKCLVTGCDRSSMSFSPSQGLRKGDPLSPYLFLFVAEALSLLLNDACARGVLQEIGLTRRAPGISHLLFADDSLLFFKGSFDQALAIKDILTVYEKGTGQMLSPDKCSIMFGKNASWRNK
ncbi:uncharacterized protein [Aegilops tauschii subsp. strangulata]|uniref:uncharacterized protein n=1 Tax=Aegilops tauschii subsp. strangulata TaxID=200361 RepID=UPI001ABD0F33|nr:uncharacterized protein LOC120967125 [Aegilops tauschii subsp. strangulata]